MNFLKTMFRPLMNWKWRKFYNEEASQTFKNIMFWIVLSTIVITVLVIAYATKVDAESAPW